MQERSWVHLPDSIPAGHRALIAKVSVALQGIQAPGRDVAIVYYSETLDFDPDAATLVLGPEDPEPMLRAVELGASGYLPVSRTSDEIAKAVKEVSAGRAVVPDEMLGSLLRRVVETRRSEPHMPEDLTDREVQVFRLAARGADKFDIAGQLDISPATARTHLANIMRKLDVNSRAALVAKAATLGMDTSQDSP